MPAERAPMRKIREVLRLKYACGLSERQIALAIGLSRSTIKAYLKRADSCGIAWPVPPEIEDATLEWCLFPPTETAGDAARPLHARRWPRAGAPGRHRERWIHRWSRERRVRSHG